MSKAALSEFDTAERLVRVPGYGRAMMKMRRAVMKMRRALIDTRREVMRRAAM